MTKSKTAVKNADEFERLNSKRGEQMKYLGKPAGMWALFAGSFEKHLTVEFDRQVLFKRSGKQRPHARRLSKILHLLSPFRV